MTDLIDIHWYIGGPMSGIPGHNIPLFDHVQMTLLDRGYQVTSPAELDGEEVRFEALRSTGDDVEFDEKGNHTLAGESWGDFLARDVKLIADSDIFGIVLLPGWEQSRGARLEAFVGLLQGEKFRFVLWENEDIREVPQSYIKRLVTR